MNRDGIKLLVAMLLAYGLREFVKWLGYSTFVGTLAGLATLVAFYGINFLMLRKKMPKP